MIFGFAAGVPLVRSDQERASQNKLILGHQRVRLE